MRCLRNNWLARFYRFRVKAREMEHNKLLANSAIQLRSPHVKLKKTKKKKLQWSED